MRQKQSKHSWAPRISLSLEAPQVAVELAPVELGGRNEGQHWSVVTYLGFYIRFESCVLVSKRRWLRGVLHPSPVSGAPAKLTVMFACHVVLNQ